MPRGASPKRERQYEDIKQSAKKSGRYRGRAEEVAARTVNKIRREKGETKAQRSSGRKKTSSRSSAGRSRSTKSRTSANGRSPPRVAAQPMSKALPTSSHPLRRARRDKRAARP